MPRIGFVGIRLRILIVSFATGIPTEALKMLPKFARLRRAASHISETTKADLWTKVELSVSRKKIGRFFRDVIFHRNSGNFRNMTCKKRPLPRGHPTGSSNFKKQEASNSKIIVIHPIYKNTHNPTSI